MDVGGRHAGHPDRRVVLIRFVIPVASILALRLRGRCALLAPSPIPDGLGRAYRLNVVCVRRDGSTDAVLPPGSGSVLARCASVRTGECDPRSDLPER